MKASTLVSELNELIKKFGDLEVTNESDSIIKGVTIELNVLGEGTSHFILDESFADIDEFASLVKGYIEDGKSGEEAREAAFEELG